MERVYPCDLGECPFGESNSMYFCRDHCGLGVEEICCIVELIDGYEEESHES